VWRRNQDLRIVESSDIFDTETFDLYSRYIKERHADGDMYPPDKDQYQSFLNNGLGNTRYFRLYDEQRLVGVMVSDQMLDGLSAIYTFYEPAEERRSLGTFSVLYQVELARTSNLEHVYLGYWIQTCEKMSYKARFKPLEMLVGGEWHRGDALPGPDDIAVNELCFVEKP